jgi:hypothetical protein
MQELSRVAIHSFPLDQNNCPPAIFTSRINFSYCIQPFVQLIQATKFILIVASLAVTQYCQRVILVIQGIFYRLVTPPAFDPTSSSFKRQIDKLDHQIISLDQRVQQLDQRFWQAYLLSSDMKKMKKLHREISGALSELNDYVSTLEQRQHLIKNQPVSMDNLIRVRDAYCNLDENMSQFCLRQGEAIIEEIQQKVFNLFIKSGVELPKDIHQQVLQIWEDFSEVFGSHLSKHPDQAKNIYAKMASMRTQVQILNKKPIEEGLRANMAEPLKLRNIGNSCYLDSVLQCLFCIDQIQEKLNKPIEHDSNHLDEYQKKLAIQHELLQFIEAQKRSRETRKTRTQMEFILFLLNGPSPDRLRKAIFKSGFHPELKLSNGLTAQHDAAYVMELLIGCFLADICQFKWREHASTPAFPGLEFLSGGKEGKDETVSMLQVSLQNKPQQKLSLLVHALLGKHIERENNVDNQRQFDPQDGEMIVGKEQEAESVIDASPAKVDQYDHWYRINKLPPVMVIQFKRFTDALIKDRRPVELPPTGILDLTRYYDAPEGESKQGRYKIKGMVRHIDHGGSLEEGHYVAEVEINGKYFHCNDMDAKSYKEVTKKAFLSHKDAYLLFLERLSEEEQAPQ